MTVRPTSISIGSSAISSMILREDILAARAVSGDMLLTAGVVPGSFFKMAGIRDFWPTGPENWAELGFPPTPCGGSRKDLLTGSDEDLDIGALPVPMTWAKTGLRRGVVVVGVALLLAVVGVANTGMVVVVVGGVVGGVFWRDVLDEEAASEDFS